MMIRGRRRLHASARLAIWLGVVAVVVVLLGRLQTVLLLAFLSLMGAVLLDAIVSWCVRRWGLRRGPVLVATAVVVVLVVSGFLALLVVPVVHQAERFVENLPETMSNLSEKIQRIEHRHPALDGMLPDTGGNGAAARGPQPTEVAKSAWFTVSTALGVLADGLAAFFLAIFLAWDPQRWMRGIATIWPLGDVTHHMTLLHKMGAALRSYLLSLGLAIVVMAVLWMLGLWLIGIDYPLFFGVIGGVVEVVPYVGPLIGLIPPLIIAIDMGGMTVVWVLALYAALHVIEGYVLIPLVMHKREHLPPPLVVLSILVFGSLWGILGVILAVPLGTLGYVLVVESVYRKRFVVTGTPNEEGDALAETVSGAR